MAIVLAAYTLTPTWRGQLVIVHTDSINAQITINKGICRSVNRWTHLRSLFRLSNIYNFQLKAVYIPGCLNHFADFVSSLHIRGPLLFLHFLISHNKSANLGSFMHHFKPRHV